MSTIIPTHHNDNITPIFQVGFKSGCATTWSDVICCVLYAANFDPYSANPHNRLAAFVVVGFDWLVITMPPFQPHAWFATTGRALRVMSVS